MHPAIDRDIKKLGVPSDDEATMNAVLRNLCLSGSTYRDFKKVIEPLFSDCHWWEAMLQPVFRRETLLEQIYRTTISAFYSQIHFKDQLANADNRPFWMFVAVMDQNTRPDHAVMNGKVFHYKDPIWKTHYPPNSRGCRCRVRAFDKDRLIEKRISVSDSRGGFFKKSFLFKYKRPDGSMTTAWEDKTTGIIFAPDTGYDILPTEADTSS